LAIAAAGLLGQPFLFAFPGGVSGQVVSDPTVLPADGSCRVLYQGPEMLRLPGNRVPYVDAERLDASESGELLLSGQLLYEHRVDDADLVLESGPASFVGVLSHLDGTARPLPSPSLHRHLRVRWALPRGEGGWEVVLTETASRSESIRTPWIGLWYGVFDGAEWKTFDSLSSLPEFTVSDQAPVPLVVKNGSVMWVEIARDRSTGKPLVAILGDPERSWSFQA
jgi:hypothetical protein